ncbi:MAG TPA: hypothetical protein VFD13_06225, partial [Candidatus Kapabacteria bacterium]|nr:hypothetical protein [Candidatus Kapabacteria bacterium]
AKIRGMKVVGLLGKGGGTLKPLCDIAIIAPGETSDRIQELHIKVIHIVIECAERRLYPELYGQDKQQLNLIEMSKDDYDIGLQDSVVLETSLIQYIDDGYRIKVTNLAGISEEAVKSNDGLKLVNWNPKYLHAA